MSVDRFPTRPVLLVDDEAHALTSFDIALRSSGINNTIRCNDGREVFSILAGQEIDIILLDLIMPHVTGQEILARVKEQYPEIPVIIVSGVNELETAVQCMRDGAFDFVSKPVDVGRLLPSIRRAIEIRELRDENKRLSQNFLEGELAHPEVFSAIITQSPKMQAIFKYSEAVAAGHAPILITGETGVGKELIARALHRLSGRQNEMVAVNVGGVDEHVFSDTLFGHVRGAFTGADRARPGLVEKAVNGTLFLDEIGDICGPCQVKLLRFLEEREYYPLGSDLARTSNARVIVATHADLTKCCEEGSFRKDLYYRLRTHQLRIPPLRERREDLPLLFEYFLVQAAADFNKKPPGYGKELISQLQTHHFPGNVRELKAMIYDAVGRHEAGLLNGDAFQDCLTPAGHLPRVTSGQPAASEEWFMQLDSLPSLKAASCLLIREALRRTGMNQRAAALLLGITPQALSQRLKRMEE